RKPPSRPGQRKRSAHWRTSPRSGAPEPAVYLTGTPHHGRGNPQRTTSPCCCGPMIFHWMPSPSWASGWSRSSVRSAPPGGDGTSPPKRHGRPWATGLPPPRIERPWSAWWWTQPNRRCQAPGLMESFLLGIHQLVHELGNPRQRTEIVCSERGASRPTARPVRPVRVEPVHPLGRGDLDIINAPPRTLVPDQLGLIE